MNVIQLKSELNRVLEHLRLKGIRSVLPQKHRGILIEVEDNSTAA